MNMMMDEREEAALAGAFARPAGTQVPATVPLTGAMTFEQGPVGAQKVEVLRDEARVMQRIKAIAAAAGQDWFYRFPVKKKGGGQDFIEGPTIKLANSVARLYGNCAVDSRVEDHGSYWIIYGRFRDFETGFELMRPFMQSKGASRLGGTGAEADARRLEIALAIGTSKAQRTVICNALEIFTDYAFEEARKNLVGKIGQRLDEYRQRAIRWFENNNIDLKRAELAMGRPAKAWLAPDLARIVAEIQAVTDGMATADETWPLPAPAEPTRDDKPSAPAASQAHSPAGEDDGEEAGDSTSEAASSPARSWKIAEGVVGQDARKKAILDLLDLAESAADVDAIEAEHAAFIEKLGRGKGEFLRFFGARREELQKDGQ